MKQTIICLPMLTALLFAPMAVQAQNDPGLASMIATYNDKAKSSLKSERKMMLAESTGHIWVKSEINGTTNIQKEFNEYLSQFRNIIIYAAQIYGFYNEIEHLVGNMNSFSQQLDKHPANSVAVALSPQRNEIYRELIMNSVDIVNDIRQVCFDSSKMTEEQRMEIVFGIRPKLKTFNKKLQRLTKAVKYTSLGDIWLEIDNHSREGADKDDIAKQCFRRWRSNSKIR